MVKFCIVLKISTIHTLFFFRQSYIKFRLFKEQPLLINSFCSSYLPKYLISLILFLRINTDNKYMDAKTFINLSYAKLNRGRINRITEVRY